MGATLVSRIIQGWPGYLPWPPPFPFQFIYYFPATVAYPKYRQDLTHRGVVWFLENETPFLEREVGSLL
jgi:hypothetical protein